ncbi:MAG: monofunctional biosynthetic peptidoglycan transglycosylase [Nitrospirota bacterium]
MIRRGRRSRPVRRGLAWALLAVGAATVAFGAYVYLTLPDVRGLKTKNPTRTAFMALREREYRNREGRAPKPQQTWVPLKRISPNLVDAVLLAEDAAFYQHDGVDYHELWESMKINWKDRKMRRGGSTITQQLAKNLYLSPERTVTRKARELLIARRLERDLGKRRILEIYLNVVEWGRNVYGAEEAARRYYGVRARDLTPAQGATLAGMLINPIKYTPDAPSSRLSRRKRIILERMAKYGKITPQEYRLAMGIEPPRIEAAPPEPAQPAPSRPAPEPPVTVEALDDALGEDDPIAEPPPADLPPLELTDQPVEDVLPPAVILPAPAPPAGESAPHPN